MIGLELAHRLSATAESGDKISLGQIEQRLRAVRSEVAESAKGAAGPGVVAIAGATGLCVVLLSYLLGRRRGKRRATVLEIRRI